MDQIEVSRLISCLLFKMSTLVVTYIAYEENTIGHAALIDGSYL